jgi:pimeloyl-ACP methyl ester carboxylesterase
LTFESLRTLAARTLVVAGLRDAMTPFKTGAALAKEIPGARLVALDAGHAMPNEAPRELVAALREHLAA